jgi:hypothetical protein
VKRTWIPVLAVVLVAGCAVGPVQKDAPRGDDPARTPERAPARAERRDSLTPRPDGSATLRPVARIGDDRITENSGIAYAGGWWWTHNDSGDGPYLYRSRSAWFETSERITVPGAKAVDWEELTVLDGDVLVCDIGDNGRKRDDLMIYRVRPTESGVETVATYPVTYPDGKHDAEGVWVWDGRVHIAIKNRGEEAHWVYRFGELQDGETNTPRLVGSVDLPDGEQITAADSTADGYVALLSYAQLMLWPADAVRGMPEKAFTLHARQCEALAWTESGVIFTNEQRDVYFVDDLLACELNPWLPPSARVRLERIPAGGGAELLPELPVRNLREGEWIRMGLVRERLVIDLLLTAEEDVIPTEERLGTSVLLAFATESKLRITPDDPVIALALAPMGGPGAIAMNLGAGRSTVETDDISVEIAGRNGHVGLRAEIPVAALFPEGLPRSFRMALAGNGLRKGDDEPLLGALDAFSLLRPYAWAEVIVE